MSETGMKTQRQAEKLIDRQAEQQEGEHSRR
jgi:hypothetical protein